MIATDVAGGCQVPTVAPAVDDQLDAQPVQEGHVGRSMDGPEKNLLLAPLLALNHPTDPACNMLS